MKKLFNAIRKSDLETVRQIILKQPELVNCVAKQPPKKDDGQSPLQVALKTGNNDIAEFLIDNGAELILWKMSHAVTSGELPFFMMQ